jgi:hypothetical protein
MKPLATGTPVNMWTCEEDGAAPDALLQRLSNWQSLVENLKLTLNKTRKIQ